jgi:hypothetical protein
MCQTAARLLVKPTTMSATPSSARPNAELIFLARAKMPSAPSMIALIQSSAPPTSIARGLPHTQQPAAVRPRLMARNVTWLGVMEVRYTARTNA